MPTISQHMGNNAQKEAQVTKPERLEKYILKSHIFPCQSPSIRQTQRFLVIKIYPIAKILNRWNREGNLKHVRLNT